MPVNTSTDGGGEGARSAQEGGTRRYFDPSRGRLIDVHVSEAAVQRYWDHHWERVAQGRCLSALHSPNPMVLKVTQRYLARGARILEGGCGLGQNVWGLERVGYSAWGIDNAQQTMAMVREVEPGLKLFCGDVRALDFPEASFDGYWSLGVIEHFWSGYDEILSEMARVLRPGGYLFLTFPAMNPGRKARAMRSCYPTWNAEVEAKLLGRFYQFMLPVDEVERDLRARGFATVEKRFVDGYKGAKDEYPLVQRLSGLAAVAGLGRLWGKGLNLLASWRWGHVALMVMQRR